MDAQEYWRRRALYAKQKELNSANDYEDAMRSRLKDLQREVEKEAYKYIELYAKTNNINIKQAANYLKTIDTSRFSMTLEEWEAKAKTGGYEKELNSEYYKSRIARLKRLNSQLGELSSKYATDEEKRMGYELAKEYQDTYYMDQYAKYLAVGGLDIDFAHFNEQQLKDIVYQPWQGSDFSKRVWNNYTKVLPDMLTDVFLRSTLMGYSYRKTTELLRDRLNTFSDKVLHRLVVTEMGHAQEQATEKFYEDSKIEKYQYLATLETHTCEECRHLDHKIFEVKKALAGENYPLLHPYCRCTTVPYMDDLPPIQSRWYRDPVTGKGRWAKNNFTYDEWKKANSIKEISWRKFLAWPSAKLSLEEKGAIARYTSSEAYTLNDNLRRKIKLSSIENTLIHNLDKALDKIPYYSEKEPLNRSLSFMYPEDQVDFVNKALVQGYIQEPSYTSASAGMVYNSEDNLRIVIVRSHSGHDIREFNADEGEVLFKRNTRFDILRLNVIDGKPYIEVVEHEEKD